MRKRFIKKMVTSMGFYLFLIFFLCFMLFPVYWLFTGSIKTFDQLFDPSTLIPTELDFIHYTDAPGEGMITPSFLLQLRNSIVIALSVSAMVMCVSVPAGYALARLRFRFSKVFAQMVLFSYLFPGTFLIIPIAVVMSFYGLYDTIVSVILAEVAFTSPFCIYLLTGYFKSIPKEIEESAFVDGCSIAGALIRIVLPLAAPALVAVTMYAFLSSWNNYLFVLVLTSSREVWTLPVGVAELIASDVVPWGKMFAMAVVYALPSVILFFLLNKYIVGGLTKGAVKA